MERVGRELGDVALRGHEPAQRGVDLVGPDARGIEEGLSLDQLDDGASGRRQRTAALGVEARLGDALALDPHADAQQVAAGRATGHARVGRVGENAPSGRGFEVFCKRTQDEPTLPRRRRT